MLTHVLPEHTHREVKLKPRDALFFSKRVVDLWTHMWVYFRREVNLYGKCLPDLEVQLSAATAATALVRDIAMLVVVTISIATPPLPPTSPLLLALPSRLLSPPVVLASSTTAATACLTRGRIGAAGGEEGGGRAP